MGLSIKNPEVERLARSIALEQGVSITEAIRRALKRYTKDGAKNTNHNAKKDLEALRAIVRKSSKRQKISNLTDDEILGYDKCGVPGL